MTQRCQSRDVGWNDPSLLPSRPMPTGPLTVVFVHSIAGSAAQWAPQLAHLGARYPTLSVTLPGHAGAEGGSSYTVEVLAEAVLAQAGDRARLVLVGHSGGALVAAHLAAAHPDRVRGLLLVDPGSDGRAFPREMAEPMLAALRSEAYPQVASEYWGQILAGARPSTHARAMADLSAADPRALPGFLSAMQTYDAVTPIRAYAQTHPVLAVITPLSEGERALAEASDRVEVVRVPETSHWVQLDRPEAVNAALDRLLGRVAPLAEASRQ
jgi:pimeloyl-ACP methyl ester carboxylesterase